MAVQRAVIAGGAGPPAESTGFRDRGGSKKWGPELRPEPEAEVSASVPQAHDAEPPDAVG
jgi:hypothetical protein